MNLAEVDDRPTKKRRFFVEDASSPETSTVALPLTSSLAPQTQSVEEIISSPEDGFDVNTLNAVVGEQLSDAVVKQLQKASSGNLERGKFNQPKGYGSNTEKAINLYLDGSWKSIGHSQILPSRNPPSTTKQSVLSPRNISTTRTRHGITKRYIGAFGVTGWATRSGVGLLSYGETARIERAKPIGPAAKSGKQPRFTPHKRQDVVVRFTNSRGEEVGRLENDSAAWISTLMDQNICRFEGSCVFAPDRIRTNDNIYLQLRCSFSMSAFDTLDTSRLDSNRPSGPFEAQESSDERGLRLRQVALIKLFEEINIKPTKSNEQTEKQKRDALLLAAEQAEQRDQELSSIAKPSTSGSSPSIIKSDQVDEDSTPDEEKEEGEEVQQDQLDALYKKAQTFDFNTPEADPPNTFTLNLRKYQRQALYWMMNKEKNQKSRDQSIHPLWDQYSWPVKDVEDKDLPVVEGQDYFYINSYSGELSLEFPVQEQNCLGGILADGMIIFFSCCTN
jgi:DNA repair protein RAD5